MPRKPSRCTQAEIARALRAAAQVGVPVTVDLIPDGTIRIGPVDGNKPVNRQRDIKL